MTLAFFDSETCPIERAALAPEPVCGQWAIDSGEVHIALYPEVPIRCWLENGYTIVGANIAFDMAVALAADPELWLLIIQAYDGGRIRDVQLECKLLDIADGEYERWESLGGWGLQKIARRIGIRIDKDSDDVTGAGSWRLRFKALKGIPISNWPSTAVQYATLEIPATRAVHESNERRAAEWRLRGVEVLGWHSKHAAFSAFALHLMSCWGVLTDPIRVENVAARTEEYIRELSEHLIELGWVRSDLSKDTKAAARAMVDACFAQGRPVTMTDGAEKKEREAIARYEQVKAERELKAAAGRKTGALDRKLQEIAAQWYRATPESDPVHLPGVKVDKDECILSASEDLITYADFTSAGLLRGRIERMRSGVHLPLQTRFDPLKETARTSSTQPQEPLEGDQTQNYPRSSGATRAEKAAERKGAFFIGLRECYEPRPDYDFIAADISMAELHCLSQICKRLFGYSEMGRMLNEGIDLHWQFAGRSLGGSIDDVAVRKEGGGWKAKAEEFGEHRDRAKPANFGFPGGMGPDKFILYSRKGYGVRFERDEVVRLKSIWLETFPEVREYLRWISRQLEQQGGVFTSVHPITGFVRGGCAYTEGANHHFQHLCAYGAKEALWEVTKRCHTPGNPLYGCRGWNFIHDEIVMEAPCAIAPEAAIELGRVITTVFNAYVPDFPTSAEGLVTRVWSKKAKPVKDKSTGRLIPWRMPVAMAA